MPSGAARAAGRVMRGVALAALAGSGAAVLALHALRPDLQPWGHRLSEYANGPWGWLMVAAFLGMAAGLVALAVAVAVHRRSGVVPLVVRRGLEFAAVGLLLSAVFPTGASPAQEIVHSRASAVATVTLTVVAVLWSVWSPASADRDTGQRAMAAGVAVMALASPLLHDTPLTGLGQRLLWALLGMWLAGAAWRLRQTAA